MRLARLGHHLSREVGGLPLDALAHHEERIGIHLGFLGRQHLLHRLLVVLDEGLAQQRDLLELLLHAALHHLLHDVGGLARFGGLLARDLALSLDQLGADFVLG